MRVRRGAVIAVALLAALVVPGCRGIDEPGDGGTDAPSVLVVEIYDADEKPGVRLTYGDQQVEVDAFAYCWSEDGVGACADGAARWPEQFVEVPTGTSVEVTGIHDSIEDFTLVQPFEEEAGPDFEGGTPIALTDDAGVLQADPGDYGLDIFAYLPQGDGAFMAGVRVTDGQPT
jgi:hypothetical protein